MSKILPFKGNRKSMKLKLIIVIALCIGAFLGFYLPDFISQTGNDNVSPNSKPIKGDIQGFATITDGDTIKIDGVRIRFHGIDAPEMNQPCWKDGNQYQCGVEAKAYLNHIINNQTVTCITHSTDQYGRKVSECYNYKNEDIEALMVSAGMAVAYTYYSYDYIIEETQARTNNVGIWAGDFENPYEFRKK